MSKPEKSVESIPESPQKTPKPYFFVMKVCHRRTDEIIAKRCGVVFADNEENAQAFAWEKYGSDSSCALEVWEIPEEGMSFTVYKSEIR